MIEYDGVKAAQIVFEECFLGPLQGVVEVQLLFSNYGKETVAEVEEYRDPNTDAPMENLWTHDIESIEMTTRILTETGKIRNEFKERIDIDNPSELQEILKQEFDHWQSHMGIEVVVKVDARDLHYVRCWEADPTEESGYLVDGDQPNYNAEILIEKIRESTL